MNIAVQVSPQKESNEGKTQNSVENQLIYELENMFKRENLQNNSYLIYNMNANLETSFDVIYNENKIKTLSQDRAVILSALKNTKNLKINEEKKNITPIIPTQKNKIIISNIEKNEEEDLKKFLIQGVEDQDCEFIFDRKNCCRVVFKDELKTEKFFNWVSNKTFNNKPIHAYFEPENLYINFLQNIQEKKYPHKNDFSTHSSSYYPGGVGMASYPNPEMYSSMDPSSYFMYPPPPYGFDPYRFIPPPYYTNFFIRKANDNEEDNPTEEYDDGRYLKKHYERKEKYYSKDQSYYKGKNYNEYDRGYYGNKSSSNYHEDKDYYESERNKTSFNYKERERKNYDKGYDAGKKSYGTKPKGKGNTSGQGQKYYYEPKQLKDDPENFPPLIVKEERTIEVTPMNVSNIEKELNKKETMENCSVNTYTRREIIEIFQKMKKEKKISMNKALEKPHEDVFHLVEKEGDVRLEFLEPKSIKVPNSTSTTPLMTGSRPPVIIEEKKE